MTLASIITEARKRQACKELERAFLAQFGEGFWEHWFQPTYALDADGAPEVRITHNGVQVAVWRDNDNIWYVGGEALDFDPRDPEEGRFWLRAVGKFDEALDFDPRDPEEASDALLVAIDDLAPEPVEPATVA